MFWFVPSKVLELAVGLSAFSPGALTVIFSAFPSKTSAVPFQALSFPSKTSDPETLGLAVRFRPFSLDELAVVFLPSSSKT
uniref:Uncharacterized protein n=1 Tax=Rhizophora mucronata TaxID=61149 RepID=A0A2P2K647_RHIMU